MMSWRQWWRQLQARITTHAFQCTSCCSCHLKSLTSWNYSVIHNYFSAPGFLCYHNKWFRRRKAKRGMLFYAFHWYIVRHDFARVVILCVQRCLWGTNEMILRSLDLLLRNNYNCEWKNFSEIILHKYYKRIRRVS